MKLEFLVALIIVILVLIFLLSRHKNCPIPPTPPNVLPPVSPEEPPVVLPCSSDGTLSALSHESVSSPYAIAGDNSSFNNYRLNSYTFNDDVVRPNGGYLFLYDAPSDTTPYTGPANSISGNRPLVNAINVGNIINPPNQGVKIIDYADYLSFPNGHSAWLPFDLVDHFIPAFPSNCNTSPDPIGGLDSNGNVEGYSNQTIGVTEWIDATNVNFVDNGTSVDVSWDPIPGVEEYTVSLIYTGTTGTPNCFTFCNRVSGIQIEFGKIVSGSDTSTSVTVSQVSQGVDEARVGFWSSVENIQARVVGYALCNKSAPVTGCVGI